MNNAWGCAWADVDADGDLDLAVASPDGVRLLRNDSPAQGYLTVVCKGGMPQALAAGTGQSGAPGEGLSNGAALGARISVMAVNGTMLRELQSCKGLGSGNEPLAHFGLGAAAGRVSIVVRFPSGRVATRAVMQTNQRLVIDEYAIAKPAGDAVQPAPQTPEAPRRTETPGGAVARPGRNKRGG